MGEEGIVRVAGSGCAQRRWDWGMGIGLLAGGVVGLRRR